jgi:hypothetical protein
MRTPRFDRFATRIGTHTVRPAGARKRISVFEAIPTSPSSCFLQLSQSSHRLAQAEPGACDVSASDESNQLGVIRRQERLNLRQKQIGNLCK